MLNILFFARTARPSIKHAVHYCERMGSYFSAEPQKSKHILWCDTEGGVRDKPLWDATFIDETDGSVVAHRFCSVAYAHKPGRQQLLKTLPADVYSDSLKNKSTCVLQYVVEDDKWTLATSANADMPLALAIGTFLHHYRGSVLCAWNLKGHDRHVLTRALGKTLVDDFVLWDTLQWFRSHYTLPKNTMSSSKAGTPRGLFDVATHGKAHDSFADAAHMRDVVMRAAACLTTEDTANASLKKYKGKSRVELLEHVWTEVQLNVAAAEWHDVVDKAWANGVVPVAVYSEKA